MKETRSELHHLSFKAWLLSLLLHLVVFQLFVFQIPFRPEAFKPGFTFLGSILSPSEFTNIEKTFKKNGSKKGIETTAYEMTVSPTPFQYIRNEKPIQKAQTLTEQKTYTKSIFIKNDSNAPAAIDEKKSLGIDPTLEPYKPLRLKSHDQN